MQYVLFVLLSLLAIFAVHQCITVLLPPPNFCPLGMRRDHRGLCRAIYNWHDSDAISA
uniref:Uncharacterized protein n=1 Tax=Anopheles minimus TaxID=112268 RepID=A0A182WP54_9DIPT